ASCAPMDRRGTLPNTDTSHPGVRGVTTGPAAEACRERVLPGFLIIAWMMTLSLDWRSTMLRNARVQMAAVLAARLLLGYLAASGRLNPFQRAEAADLTTGATGVKPTEPGGGTGPACCDGVNKGQLLARADANASGGGAGGQNGDKKPNIVMLMTDDTGWND